MVDQVSAFGDDAVTARRAPRTPEAGRHAPPKGAPTRQASAGRRRQRHLARVTDCSGNGMGAFSLTSRCASADVTTPSRNG